MINDNSFIMYESAYKQVMHIANKVNPEAAIQLMNDLARFGLYGEWPDEDSVSFIYGFEQMATSISSAIDRRNKNKTDGTKGGRPRIELDKVAIMAAYEELHNWEKVAARFNVSAKTLREKRKEWADGEKLVITNKKEENIGKNSFSLEEELQVKKENTGSIGRNLNENVNVNVNVNAPRVPRFEGAAPPNPCAPDGDNKIVKKKREFDF